MKTAFYHFLNFVAHFTRKTILFVDFQDETETVFKKNSLQGRQH